MSALRWIADATLGEIVVGSIVVFIADYLLIRSGAIDGLEDDIILWLHNHSSAPLYRLLY